MHPRARLARALRGLQPCRPARRGSAGHERRVQQCEDVRAAPDQRACRRLLPQRTQDVDLGHHPDHSRIDREQQQVRVVAPHPAGIHLGFQELRRALYERLEGDDHAGSGRRAKPRHLSDHAEQLRSARREAKHRSDDGFHLLPSRTRAVERALHRGSELTGASGDHGIEQRVLAREPVEDRLLPEPEPSSEGVERGPLVAARTPRREGRVEDAVTGRRRWAGRRLHVRSVPPLSTKW